MIIRVLITCLLMMISSGYGQDAKLSIRGESILYKDKPIKLIGLRCSNALISDSTTNDLIEALDLYQDHGLNTVSVFVMGSRFGDVKGYLPDTTMSLVHRDRLERILQATQARQMITIVGCLYWGTSKAKEDLSGWSQEQANQAVANTARWLGDKKFTHVILDPDNEGMAGREMKWKTELLIRAAKAANPQLIIANNARQKTTVSEDLNMHFGYPEPGKPWLDSEYTSKKTSLGSYWIRFSRETYEKDKTYNNYSRIGRYTSEMKEDHFAKTREYINNHSGILFASTWLQCPPDEEISGPFAQPGGYSNLGSGEDKQASWNMDIDTIHHDAGIRWWLEFVKENYGSGQCNQQKLTQIGWFVESKGELVIEAENYTKRTKSTYARYQHPHTWERKNEKPGFSGKGYLQILPDEWPEHGQGPPSPRDTSGATLTYPIRITTAGDYWVYVRGFSLGGESNGLHIGSNGVLAGKGTGASNISGFRPHHKWVWENQRKHGFKTPATIELTQGDHELTVWNRDDGFCLDKIVLRQVKEEHVGSGPDESLFITE